MSPYDPPQAQCVWRWTDVLFIGGALLALSLAASANPFCLAPLYMR